MGFEKCEAQWVDASQSSTKQMTSEFPRLQYDKNSDGKGE